MKQNPIKSYVCSKFQQNPSSYRKIKSGILTETPCTLDKMLGINTTNRFSFGLELVKKIFKTLRIHQSKQTFTRINVNYNQLNKSHY